MTDTRERIVETERRAVSPPGLRATGVKQIVDRGRAPFGSLYHFFPGGKEQLGAEAIRAVGRAVRAADPGRVRPRARTWSPACAMFFAGAAEHLVETDYEDACPIATVALEVSSSSETIRQACADVFESWIAAGAALLRGRRAVDPSRRAS